VGKSNVENVKFQRISCFEILFQWKTMFGLLRMPYKRGFVIFKWKIKWEDKNIWAKWFCNRICLLCARLFLTRMMKILRDEEEALGKLSNL